jgi:uncharacterized membrane protein
MIKMKNTFKQDKGTAGLTILLSLIVMLFIIGLIVMIFSLMGANLQSATYDENTAGASANESLAKPTTAGITLAVGNAKRDGVCGTITSVLNDTTGNGLVIGAGNYSQTGCTVTNLTSWAGYTTNVRFSYPYTYSADNSATDAINDTVAGISGVTNWFGIFIVIGAMVVLILLTVIIITAIRSSGMIAGGEPSGANKVGSA